MIFNHLLLFLFPFLYQISGGLPFPGPGMKGGGASPSTPWITGQTLGTLRTYNGCVGAGFHVITAPITVTDLGRWVPSTGTQAAIHTLHIRDGNTDAILGNCTVNTTGAPTGAYLYCSLGSPIVLANGSSAIYGVMSEESVGLPDQFYDVDTVIVTTTDATQDSASEGGWYSTGATTGTCIGSHGQQLTLNRSYAPINFKYHL